MHVLRKTGRDEGEAVRLVALTVARLANVELDI